jgi:hypothetical protein
VNLSELSRQILWHGIDDWVDMSGVSSVARILFPSALPDEVREQCVRAIGELRDGEYARVGDLRGEDGFTSWVGETGDVLRRIDEEWRAVGTPTLWQIAWLENTPIGNRIGIAEWKKWKKQKEEAGDR